MHEKTKFIIQDLYFISLKQVRKKERVNAFIEWLPFFIAIGVFFVLHQPFSSMLSLILLKNLLLSYCIGIGSVKALTKINFFNHISDCADRFFEFVFKKNNGPNIEDKARKIYLTSLIESFCHFRFLYGWAHRENDEEAFIKYLKKNIKVSELLILVNLGANPTDCHIATFEEVEAQSLYMPTGMNSLQWQAAKVINKYHFPDKNLTKNLQEIVQASKKYSF